MQPIFHFTNETPINEKFQIGSPLPKGFFFSSQHLVLVTHTNDVINAHITPVQLWPDQSIKWVSIEGLVNVPLAANQTLFLSHQQSNKALVRQNWVRQEANHLIINTEHGNVNVVLHEFISLHLNNEAIISAQISTATIAKVTGQQAISQASATNVHTQYEVVFNSLQQPLLCKITQSATIALKPSNIAPTNSPTSSPQEMQGINVHASLVVYYANSTVLANIRVHNPNAIVHQNGQWDLGNQHSVIINNFSINSAYASTAQQVQLHENEPLQAYDSLSLIQYSSGGENWQSENHVSSSTHVNLLHKGALGQLHVNENVQALAIQRPAPCVNVHISNKVLSIAPQHFWEKYPTSISSNNTSTLINFANPQSGCEVELQAGEIKSHTIGFAFGHACGHSGLQLNTQYVLNASNLNQSKALPFIHEQLNQHPLMAAVNLQGKVNWLHKRELVDEFGWRNFGDLYADHEAAHYSGSGIFVSHYNNQYDPLFGFVKQWLLTQNPAFKVLAEDLFDHILNIDIYHTVVDKPEYNQGLFWHTDHYVPAKTATHRTYSEHQETGVYMDHAGGGGPGAHHCYSSGLALYYLMTGNSRAKDATLGLGKWMTSIYEGDGTLLGLILRIKNANHIRLPFTGKLLLGTGTGIVRNPFTNAYPLDRGTGNYVNVLLDCFEITHQKAYIRQAEYIILNTISQHDNISQRNFSDIENTWYYVVFLQAVAKYLAIVGQHITGQQQTFAPLPKVHAIYQAFMHYAKYMAAREQHYLANKEVLEYPNDTWTGQDLRKIHVLLCAYELSNNHQMLSKATQLANIVYPALLASDEASYTRIQALIMQNYASEQSIAGSFGPLVEVLDQYNAAVHSPAIVLVNKSYISRMASFIKAYSIKHEISMLCVRIPAFKKVFK